MQNVVPYYKKKDLGFQQTNLYQISYAMCDEDASMLYVMELLRDVLDGKKGSSGSLYV